MITKNCANPKCNKSFETKNPKKMFDSLYCKNQAAYLYFQKKYKWEVILQKARRKNIRILEYLIRQGHTIINQEELKKLGFDRSAAFIPNEDEKGRHVYRFGNIGLIMRSTKEVEIFHLKTK